MTVGVGLEGDAELVARMAHASAGLLDLTDANRAISTAVYSQAGPDTPRATGALAGSAVITVTGSGWGIAYSKPYAVPVHAIRPWLITAAQQTDQLGILTEHVQQLLDGN